MKCNVVFDKEGNVASVAYKVRPESEADDGLVAMAGPVVEPEHEVVELNVPEEYGALPLAELMKRVQADAKGKPRITKAEK